MCSTVVRTLYWSYWANVFYILGMFGYLTIDTLTYLHPTLNNTFSATIYIFLSIIFVIDAILYTIDWYMYAVKLREHETDPIEYRTELVACIFLHLGSGFYFVSSLLYLKTTDPPLDTILLMNFLGIIAFLCEACLTFIGWRITLRKHPSADPKRGCVPQVNRLFKKKNKISTIFNFYQSLGCLFVGTSNEFPSWSCLFMCNNISLSIVFKFESNPSEWCSYFTNVW